MSKGNYNVGHAAPQRDASFRSCLCAMLIFIAICAIIGLAGIKWTKNEIKKEVAKDVEVIRKYDNEKSLKIILSTMPSTTTHNANPPKEVERRTSTRKPTTTQKNLHKEFRDYDYGILSKRIRTSTIATTKKAQDYNGFIGVVAYTTQKSSTSQKTTPKTTTTTEKHLNKEEEDYVYDYGIISKRNKTATTTTTTTIATTKKGVVDIFAYTTQKTSTTTPKTTTTTEKNHNKEQEDYDYDYGIISKRNKTATTTIATTAKEVQDIIVVVTTKQPSTTEIKAARNDRYDKVKFYGTTSENPDEETSTELSTPSDEDTTEAISDLGMIITPYYAETTEEATEMKSSEGPTVEYDTSESSSSIEYDSTESNFSEDATTADETTTEDVSTEISSTKEMTTEVTTNGSTDIDNYNYSSTSEETTETSSLGPSSERYGTTYTKEDESTTTSTTTTARNKDFPVAFKKQQPVCPTSACKSESSRMLSLMNHSVDACEDFYEFSCGGMQANRADADSWNTLSSQLNKINNNSKRYLQKFRLFYDTCVRYEEEFKYEERVNAVKSILNATGYIRNESTSNDLDLTDLFAQLILRGSLHFFDVDIDVDKQSSKFILQLTLPQKSSRMNNVPDWNALWQNQKRCLNKQRENQPTFDLNVLHKDYVDCKQNYSVYLNTIETSAKALGLFSYLAHDYNVTQKLQDLRTTIEWDLLEHLNEEPTPATVRKIISFREYHIQKVSDLQIRYSLIQWKRLFAIVTGHDDIQENTTVQIYFDSFFTHMFKKLGTLSKLKLYNALLSMYANDLYQYMVIPKKLSHRQEYCLELTSKLFPDISANMYSSSLQPQENPEAEIVVTNIFKRLKTSFTKGLDSAEWLDDDSQISMLLKAQQLNVVFADNDDFCVDEKHLEAKYEPLEFGANFEENFALALVSRRKFYYGLEGKTFTNKFLFSYFLMPYDKKPFSFYTKNIIAVPIGMVRKYDKKLPGYYKQVKIGILLAKEMLRQFDPVGITYNMSLSANSKVSYKNLETSMVDAFSYASSKEINHQKVSFKINGEVSMAERITDNSALRVTLDDYNTDEDDSLLPWISATYSKEQLFFIAAAQEYCEKIDASEYMVRVIESEILPSQLRIESMMSNSQAFIDAFECPAGSGMDNAQKLQFPFLQKPDDDEDYAYTALTS